MRIAVVGSTGVLGRHVLPRLVERGHQVRAVVRRPDQARSLGQPGVEAVLADILDADSLGPAVAGCGAALHLATAIPRPGQPQDWRLNDRIRGEGTRNLLAACLQQAVGQYVQQSITLVMGDHGTEIVDEAAAVRPGPIVQSAIEMEAAVQAAPLAWCILRGGLFYGPGTGRDQGWRQAARSGELRWRGDGRDLVSLVHVADMARAVVQAVERAPQRRLFNVVDDRPVNQRELYQHVARLVGGREAAPGGDDGLPSLGCRNARIKSELAWSPAYPTFRSGLAA